MKQVLIAASCVCVLAAAWSAAPPGARDSHGDPLPAGAVARLGSARLRHAGAVDSVLIGPRNRLLSEGGGEVQLHDLASGRRLRRWRLKDEVLVREGLSDDGRTLALAGARGIRFLDLATGKERRLAVALSGSQALALSPDGKLLAVPDERHAIRLVDPATGNVLRRLDAHRQALRVLVFSPDGTALVSAEEGRTLIWKTATGKVLHTLHHGKDPVLDACFSPDGKRLAVLDSSAAPARVLDLASGRVLTALQGSLSPQSIRFSPKGDLLAVGSSRGHIHLFNPATGQQERRFGRHAHAVVSLAWSSDGKVLAAGSGDGTVSVWDPAAGTEARLPRGHAGDVGAVAFSPDGRLAATADWNTVRVWDVRTARLIQEWWMPGSNFVTSLTFSADGKRLYYGGSAGGGQVWDLATWRVVETFDERRGAHFVLSPDGKRTAAAESAGAVVVRATATGRRIAQWRLRGAHEVEGLAFSLDSALLFTVSSDRVVRVWKAATGEELRRFSGSADPVPGIALSPDGRTLATPEGKSVVLWEVATGQPRLRIPLPHAPRVLAFHPDGALLASGGDQLQVWASATGRPVAALRGHTGGVTALAFSSAGTRLLSGGLDRTALVWDVAHLRPIRHLVHLEERDLEEGWERLAGNDAVRAYQTLDRLGGAPGAVVPFLTRRLLTAPKALQKRVRALLADLDSDEFETRQRAERELDRIADEAAPVLRRFLADRPGLEARRRVERLLRRLERGTPSPNVLRQLRCAELLERLATAAARELLKNLARGREDDPLTREAKAALQRLERPRRAS